jgi:HSP90 family molecular chaperone
MRRSRLGTSRSAPDVTRQHAADEEAVKKRETDKTAYTKLWNEFGKALKMGVVEDTANRNRLAKLLRVHFPTYGCRH